MKKDPSPRGPESMILLAADGFPVSATKYAASPEPIAHLVVAGATGVPQGYYRRFAEHAAAQGFTTLTLDYRGIGRSRPRSLKGFRMNYLDWARLDLAAAVEEIATTSVPLFMVGHSYGGHAFGLLPNHERVAAFYTMATGAGWHGWMPPLERLKVLTMWRVVGPLLSAWKGFLPWSLLGMGEDLPLDVYRQWRRWCSYPRYFFEDPELPGLAEQFARVRTPIVAANALDDLWALPRSRDAFMSGYVNASWKGVDLDPRQLGVDAIGHMGYFRPALRPLWDEILGWLREQPSRAGLAA